MTIFPTTAEREDTPVLIMISRKKAFTVLGLIFIRFAIALLFRPCSKYSNTSRSRCVKLNRWETCDKDTNPEGPLSSRTAMLGREGNFAGEPNGKVRQRYCLLPDRNSVTKGNSPEGCWLMSFVRTFPASRSSELLMLAGSSG